MKVSWRERLRYWFDNTLAKGAPALVMWLAVVFMTMVLILGSVIALLAPGKTDTGKERSFLSALWMALLRGMDPGTLGGDVSEEWPFLALMFVVTLGGIVIFSALVGVIATGLDSKITQLRKGRSRVIEHDHTVLLGWSEQVFVIVSELVEANESEKRAAVAILADRDKVEMEDELRERVPDTKTTRVVCRTGSPLNPGDLDIVNPGGARSIIVLPPDDEDPDSQVVKTLLAITNRPGARQRARYHVVAAVTDPQNLTPARLAGGRDSVVIDAEDIAARLVVQTALQSGLSVVYTDLLDFDGDEIYMTEEPAFTGHQFGQILFAYDACSVLGLHRSDGVTLINPPMNTVIGPGDQVILIAEDDSTVRLGRSTPQIDRAAIVRPVRQRPAPKRILILGWNERAPLIVSQLDAYVPPGSVLDVVADRAGFSDELGMLSRRLHNMSVNFKDGDTADRITLESIGIGAYDNTMVLGDDSLETQRSDSRTLITLLHLRDMEARLGERYSIVSEMGDDRNRELAQITQADDFIVSDKLISLLLTQISENRHLSAVFSCLFEPEGSEIYLKPAEEYVVPGRPVNFHTVVDAARIRGELALGYRLQAEASVPPAHGVVLNPDKTNVIVLGPGDKVIVLAED